MRGGRILWGQIAVIFTIVLVMTWAATQWAAFRVGFQPQLGNPWFELAGLPAHNPLPAPKVRSGSRASCRISAGVWRRATGSSKSCRATSNRARNSNLNRNNAGAHALRQIKTASTGCYKLIAAMIVRRRKQCACSCLEHQAV